MAANTLAFDRLNIRIEINVHKGTITCSYGALRATYKLTDIIEFDDDVLLTTLAANARERFVNESLEKFEG